MNHLRKLASSSICTLVPLLGACGCTVETGELSDMEHLDQQEQAITNGVSDTNNARLFGAVAINGGMCSGTLLTNEWVLTAEHCAPAGSSTLVGMPIKYDTQTQSVVSEVRHPSNVPSSNGIDVLLVKVATPFTINGANFGFRRSLWPGDGVALKTQTLFAIGNTNLQVGPKSASFKVPTVTALTRQGFAYDELEVLGIPNSNRTVPDRQPGDSGMGFFTLSGNTWYLASVLEGSGPVGTGGFRAIGLSTESVRDWVEGSAFNRTSGNLIGVGDNCLEDVITGDFITGSPLSVTEPEMRDCKAASWRFTNAQFTRTQSLAQLGSQQRCLTSSSIITGSRLKTVNTCTPGASSLGTFAMRDTEIVGLADKCVDVSNFSVADGAKIQLFSCNGGGAQKWSFRTDGSVNLKGTNKCLDVQNGSLTGGTKVQLFNCNGGGAQKWILRDRSIRLAANSNLCLDVQNAAFGDGTQLQVWPCNGLQAQKWRFRGQYEKLSSSSVPSGLCLDVMFRSIADGTKTQLLNCSSVEPAQRFEYVP